MGDQRIRRLYIHRTPKIEKNLRLTLPDLDSNPQMVCHIGPKDTLVHVTGTNIILNWL